MPCGRVQRLAADWTVRGSTPGGTVVLRTRTDQAWGPPRLLYNGYGVIPRGGGVKRPRLSVDHPPLSSAEVEKGLKAYLYSPSVPSWHVIGWTSPFIIMPFMWCPKELLLFRCSERNLFAFLFVPKAAASPPHPPTPQNIKGSSELWSFFLCTSLCWSVNLVKLKTYLMYHQLWHSEIFCSAQNVFVCFVWISEQTAIISLYNINWLVLITDI